MHRLIAFSAALLLFALVSCSGSDSRSTSDLDASPAFTLSDAELDAFVASPEISADAIEVTPGRLGAAPPEMPGTVSAGGKGTSTVFKHLPERCKSHKKWNCKQCKPKKDKKPKCGSCGKSDCKVKKCKQCDDCRCKSKDKCKDKKPKCSSCGKSDCKVKKCSQCNDCGCKSKDKCKDKKSKCGSCGKSDCKKLKCKLCDDCRCPKRDHCKPPPPPPCVCAPNGICNLSERFFTVCDCDDQFGDICFRAKVLFTECPCDDCDKAGREVIFCLDGVEVGRALTDDEGWAYFCKERLPVGTYKGTVKLDNFSADLRAVVYDACHHACAVGKGRLPTMNGGRYAIFSYEFHFNGNDLVYGGWFNFDDGDISYVNEPVTWFLSVGPDVHFGNGEFYMLAADRGKLPGEDYAEIYVWDQEYDNRGQLLNGQIRLSWGLGILPPGQLPTI